MLPDSAEKVQGNSHSSILANIVMGLRKVDEKQFVLDEIRLHSVAAIASASLSIKAEATSSAAVKAVAVEQPPAKRPRTKKT